MKLTPKMRDTITELPTDYLSVWAALPRGYEKAVSRPYLVSVTGLSDRKIRKIIADLVAMGLPVGSSTANPGGYYKIATEKDLEMARHMKGRAFQLLQRDKNLEKIGQVLFGLQPTLFDEIKENIS